MEKVMKVIGVLRRPVLCETQVHLNYSPNHSSDLRVITTILAANS